MGMGLEWRESVDKKIVLEREGMFWMCGGGSKNVMTWRMEPIGREQMMRRINLIGCDLLEVDDVEVW